MVQEHAAAAKARPSPKATFTNLKKKPSEYIEALFMDLRNEDAAWAKEFIEIGGVGLLTKILEENMTKKHVLSPTVSSSTLPRVPHYNFHLILMLHDLESN